MTVVEPEVQVPQQQIDPEKLIQEWQSKYNSAKTARLPFERQWHLNMAFYLGKHWVTWNTDSITPTARLVEPVSSKRRTRLTVNYCRLICRKELAKMNKSRIRGFIASSTSDDDDIAASRAGDKLAEYFQFRTKLARVMKTADFWCTVYGTSFVKHYYDPMELGPDGPVPLIDPNNQQVMDPRTGQPVMTKQPMPGMPKAVAISPFNILVPNIDETEIENQEWVMHCVVMTAKQIFDAYGVEVDEEGEVANSTADSRQQSAYGNQQNVRRRGVEVKEVWAKPNKQFPEGLWFVFAGDKVLKFEPAWPYMHKEYPFSKRYFIETGRFYGECTLTDLIPLNIEYNASRSQLIDNRNISSRPAILSPRGAIDVRKYNNNPGGIIEYRPGLNPPTALSPPQAPNYIMPLFEMLNNEVKEISSQFEGNVPNGVEAAAAISYLMENQDSVLEDTLRDKEEVWQKIITQFLSYAIQYWDGQRIVRVVGRNQNFEAFTLKGADLRSNTDFRVEVGSATPESRSAKQAKITELMKMGVVLPEKGLQYMELGDTAKLYEEMQIDVRQSERENLKMSQGVPIDIHPYDDHMIHIREHDNYRKREEFENADENVQAMFGNHVIRHLMALATTYGMPINDPQMAMVVQAVQSNPTVYDKNMETTLRDFVMQMQAANGVAQEEEVPSGQAS